MSHGYSDRAYDSFSTMADYVQPVEHMLQQATEPVVLLGHSAGGVTLTYLAERYPDKIATLIYLTAFMVPNGKKSPDYYMLNATNPSCKELFEVLLPVNDGRGLMLDVQKRSSLKAAFYDDCSDHDFDIALRNINATTSTVPDSTVSTITAERFGKIPRVYIECTLDKALPIECQRLMNQDVPGAKVVSLAASHSPFFSMPAELAQMIQENI